MKRLIPLLLLALANFAGAASKFGAVPVAINPSFTVSSSSIVAPAIVFFDATATVVGGGRTAFRDVSYKWNFGDSASVGAAVWAHGALSEDVVAGNTGWGKNVEIGPVAAHVFENGCPADVCTVTLTTCVVCDGTDNVLTTQAITVYANSDPVNGYGGTRTTCVGAGTTPTAGVGFCPPGAAVQNQANFKTALTNWLNAAYTQVLFDPAAAAGSFVSTTSYVPTGAGPRSIGAGGAGSRAKLTNSGTANNSAVFDFGATTGSWTIADIEFAPLGDANDDVRTAGGTSGNTHPKGVLLLRAYVHDIGAGFEISCNTSTVAYSDVFSIVDSTIQHIITRPQSPQTVHTHGVLTCGQRTVLMGTLFDDSLTPAAEHMQRIQWFYKFIDSHNTVSRVNPQKEMMTLRGINSGSFTNLWPTGCPDATAGYAHISDNFIKLNSYVGIQTTPVNDSQTTCIGDTIIDGNLITVFASTDPGTQSAISIHGARQTVRNNIIVGSTVTLGQTMTKFIEAQPQSYNSSGVPTTVASTVVAFVNNTCYTTNSGTFTCAILDSGVTSSFLLNNIGYAPNSSGATVRTVFDSGGVNTVCLPAALLCNSTLTQIQSTGQRPWAAAAPVKPADFRSQSGSYARTNGATLDPLCMAGCRNIIGGSPTTPYRMGAAD